LPSIRLQKPRLLYQIRGYQGCHKIDMGVLIDYPRGIPDKFEYVIMEEGKESSWKELEIEGGWFPHAFIGSMAQVMMAVDGVIENPTTMCQIVF